MWYVHHLAEDVKAVLGGSGVVIPLLSVSYHNPPPGDASAAEHTLHGVYQEQVSCASCHGDF